MHLAPACSRVPDLERLARARARGENKCTRRAPRLLRNFARGVPLSARLTDVRTGSTDPRIPQIVKLDEHFCDAYARHF